MLLRITCECGRCVTRECDTYAPPSLVVCERCGRRVRVNWGPEPRARVPVRDGASKREYWMGDDEMRPIRPECGNDTRLE